MDDGGFAELLGRARAGDEGATRDLLASFEPDVRLMVRAQLPRVLRSQFDSMDFVQAVWQSVFAGEAGGESGFATAGHFRGFLAGVVRLKVLEEYRRRTRTRKYDLAREEPLYVRRGAHEAPRPVAAPDPSPSQTAQAHDRMEQLVAGRPAVEARVVELRLQGRTFEEIAELTGLGERSVRRIIESLRRQMEARQWQ